MPKRNRQTLKESFRQGKRPTEQDFENLIDSTMNMLDDGFSKSPDTGIGLAPLLGKGVVMSIYKEPGDPNPFWEISVEQETGNLHIGRHEQESTVPLIVLNKDGSVELGERGKGVELTGTLKAPSRQGTYLQGAVPANGRWHDMTEELNGCWALEVVAGCGKQNSGQYALLVATALHCFGRNRKISKTRSHYGMYGNKLCLRWVRNGFACRLQIKTIFNYGDNVGINYHITRLWDDPLMEKG